MGWFYTNRLPGWGLPRLPSVAGVRGDAVRGVGPAVSRPLRAHEVAGRIFLGTYWLLSTLAYLTQVALLPRLLGTGGPAGAWFFGNPGSASYSLAVVGYGLFG